MEKYDLTWVMLSKNEHENLSRLIPEALSAIRNMEGRHEILLIDAWSTDGTQELARSMGARVVTQSQPHYSSAMADAFREARGEYVAIMDSDGSHPPEAVANMWAHRGKADVIISSRYVPGARTKGEEFRTFLSRILNLAYRWVLGIPAGEISGGFRIYRTADVRDMPLKDRGIGVQEEILVRLYCAGAALLELPYCRRSRFHGRSTLSVWKCGWGLVKTLFRLRRNIPEFRKDRKRRQKKTPQ